MAVSVTYSEMHGSPTEGVDRAGAKTATRVLECAWGDRWTLMADLMNEDYENEAGTLMVCVEATCAPLPGANTGSGTIATYEKAVVTATYRIPTTEVGEAGDEVTESIEPYAEFLTVGTRNLRWTDATGSQLTKDQTPGILLSGLVYVFKKTFQDALPADVLNLVGHVNAAPVTPSSTGMEALSFEAETLLYQPPSITRTIDAGGNLTWDVEYRFMYRPNRDSSTPPVARGWNYFWNQNKAGGADFDKIWDVKAGAQYKHYPTGDFTAVI
jgi:hypothetical protein